MQKMIVRAEGHAFGIFIRDEPKLGRNDGLVAFSCQGARQNPLAVTGAIVRGGVEKVDAMIEGAMNSADRFLVIDVTPAARSIQPVPETADCPAAQSHRTDWQVGTSQRSLKSVCGHLFPLKVFPILFL